MKKAILSIAAAALLLSGCGQSYEEKVQQAQAETRASRVKDSLALKVGVLPTVEGMPVYLAQEKHWFDTLGVDVSVKVRNAQLDCDTALQGKHFEGALTDIKRVERMRKAGTGLQVLGPTNAYWQLLTNKHARLKDVKQLGDKMVAMTRYSATDYLTDQALKGVKTSAAVFRIQINDVRVRLAMLKNNEMDAMWLTEPQATEARLAGNPVIKDSRKMKEQLGVVAFRSAIFADQRRRKQVEDFVKAYNQACDSLNRFGLLHYIDVAKQCLRTDEKTLRALPKLKFIPISMPK